jgi:transposase
VVKLKQIARHGIANKENRMTLAFTDADRKALDYERYHYPHPMVQRKMEVVWLKSQGQAPDEISQLASVSVATVYRYLAEFRTGGLEQLKQLNLYRPKSELVAHQKTIEARFRDQPPASMKEAAQRIEQLTGIKRGKTQVGMIF